MVPPTGPSGPSAANCQLQVSIPIRAAAVAAVPAQAVALSASAACPTERVDNARRNSNTARPTASRSTLEARVAAQPEGAYTTPAPSTSPIPIHHCICNSICIRISMAGQCLPHVPHVKLKNAPPTDATSCHRLLLLLLPNCKTAKQLQQLPSMPPALQPPRSLCPAVHP